MGEECSTYGGGRKRCIKGLVGKPEGEIPLERIILKWIFRKRDIGLDKA